MATPLFAVSMYILISSAHLLVCTADDRLAVGGSLYPNQTITSARESFALGFFPPGNSSSAGRYIGIWYNSIPQQTIVWVANREKPLVDSSGLLRILGDGNLALLDARGRILWSTNVSSSSTRNTSAVLLDTGNLILRDAGGKVVWQSFDYPTDTLLPDMDLQMDFRTGLGQSLVSWKKDAQDPSPGSFSFGFDPRSPIQVVTKNGSKIVYRNGLWDGSQVAGNTDSSSGSSFARSIRVVGQKIMVSYTTTRLWAVSRIVIDSNGLAKFLFWDSQVMNWSLIPLGPSRPCDFYGRCGTSGVCKSSGLLLCQCLEGFEPKERGDWDRGDFSGGCVRRQPPRCDGTDVFLLSGGMKLPDNSSILWNTTAAQCEAKCRDDCQCSAYASANISSVGVLGSMCLIWAGELTDLEHYEDRTGQVLYVRQAASELGDNSTLSIIPKKKILPKILIPTFIIGALVIGILCYFYWRRRKVRKQKDGKCILYDEKMFSDMLDSEKDISDDVPLLGFNIVVAATNNFDPENKLGQGGFGPVYKGTMQGHEVAVKRLSKGSGQGFQEFANEVKLIAKLQHTNLVRLLGWCSHEDERILIYEYMHNGSLDKFIYDEGRSAKLDWKTRFKIINGIANGLLYLHHYSRLRVIHRDLKTSNILVNASMSPKISDFGLARIFRGDQKEAITKKIAGTYGYMSPEYALDGLFSEKSDVFSFGVILLEIITGSRSTGLYPYKDSPNLLGYVWRMWKDGRALELINPSVDSTLSAPEVMKCIHVGLLCVQDNVADRPSMHSVVLTLAKENATLPIPKQPVFAIERSDPVPAIELSSAPKEGTRETTIRSSD